jgi:cytochrome oxidase assembly protein ShyY1
MLALLIFALIGWVFAVLAGLGYWQMRKEHNDVLKMSSRMNAMYERERQERDELERQKSNLLTTLGLYQKENAQLTDLNGQLQRACLGLQSDK